MQGGGQQWRKRETYVTFKSNDNFFLKKKERHLSCCNPNTAAVRRTKLLASNPTPFTCCMTLGK